jgi:putative FmdB family regulatory protein
MPIYEYVCKQCGKLMDVLQKVSDPAPETCEGCGAQGGMTKVLSRTSFVLKGGGWYSDLYGTPKKDPPKEAPKEGPKEGSKDASTPKDAPKKDAPKAEAPAAPKPATGDAK